MNVERLQEALDGIPKEVADCNEAIRIQVQEQVR